MSSRKAIVVAEQDEATRAERLVAVLRSSQARPSTCVPRRWVAAFSRFGGWFGHEYAPQDRRSAWNPTRASSASLREGTILEFSLAMTTAVLVKCDGSQGVASSFMSALLVGRGILPPSRAEFSLKRLSYFSGPALSSMRLTPSSLRDRWSRITTPAVNISIG